MTDVQEVLDVPPQFGDTLELEAGRTYPTSTGLIVEALGGSFTGSNYFTITSTKLSECPASDTRITPNYLGVMPIIQGTGNSGALAFTGNATPAEHVKVTCVALESARSAGAMTRGALMAGNQSGSDFSYSLSAISEQPDDLIFDRIIVFSNWFNTSSRLVGLNTRSVTIKNSWLDGGGNDHVECQTISGWNSEGPWTIENNHIGFCTENIMIGGALPSLDVEPDDVTFKFNYFGAEPHRHQSQLWTASTIYFKGALIGASDGEDTLQAQNSGTSGSGEPTWPSVGLTVADNDITWKTIDLGAGTPQDHFPKNRFELKTGTNVTVKYNVFSHYWYDNQTSIMTIKGPGQGSCPAAYPTCYAPSVSAFITNNVFRHTMKGVNFSDTLDATLYGTHIFSNNLLWDVDSDKWKNQRTDSTVSNQALFLTNAEGTTDPILTAEHNTVADASGQSYAYYISGNGANPAIDMPTRYNILQYGASFGVRGIESNLAEGQSSIDQRICNGSTADATCWDDNIIIRAGGDPTGYPGGGLTIWVTSEDAIGYLNAADRLYHLDNDSTYKNAAADGRDIGVDYLSLPVIKALAATPLDDKILFTWELSAPIQHIPCAIEVSTNPGFDDYVADLDPDTYAQPDSSDHDRNVKGGSRRMAIVGANSALATSTTHYYRLSCGGDTRQYADDGTTLLSVDTLAALSSTKTVTIQYSRPGAETLEYGTTYSYATDTISGGGTVNETCAGDGCKFSWTANRGEVYYYRIQGESAAPSIIAVP